MQVVKHYAPPWDEMTPEQQQDLARVLAKIYRRLLELPDPAELRTTTDPVKSTSPTTKLNEQTPN